MIGRTNAGSSGPDFRVTSGTALPASGSEKDVFIISDVAVEDFAIVNYYPGFAAVSGYTVLHTSDISQSVGVAWPRFNVFRPSDKILSCSLDGCRQYSNGAWHIREAYQFRNGKWVQFAFLNVIPEFTYTGDYKIVNDADTPITTSDGNWKIRFLTSGVFTPTDLRGAADGIDVFCVGGGGAGGQWCNGGSDGSGGNGGYTKTSKGVTVTAGKAYNIVVGAGGASQTAANVNGKPGGKTSAFGVTANGGDGGHAWYDEDSSSTYKGGSGGGSGNSDDSAGGNGGSDGANGGSAYWSGGIGQGTTTREFGEAGKRLYSGGGGGSWGGKGGSGGGANAGASAGVNTGGGGGGGYNSGGDAGHNGGKGGSGIVIIRNHRA